MKIRINNGLINREINSKKTIINKESIAITKVPTNSIRALVSKKSGEILRGL